MDHHAFFFEADYANQDILIALLSEINFSGFEQEDHELRAYVPFDVFDRPAFEQIISSLGISYQQSIIEERNWNSEWEAGFQPVIIPDPKTGEAYATIRANFHSPASNIPFEIIITPKMSFGTGHHATTWMMVQFMSMINFKNKRVIDFGTGTGILAILAEKLGAVDILAIDCDDWSIQNTIENIATNNCDVIHVLKSYTIKGEADADIILANINLNVLVDQMHTIKLACKRNATVLLSGILVSDQNQLSGTLAEHGFEEMEWLTKDRWAAVLARCQQ